MRTAVRGLCLILAFVFALMLFPVRGIYAAGVSVSAPGRVAVGDTVRVSVSFSGNQIMGVNASFSYDSSILSFAGGSSSVSNGKIVLYASEGKSSLSVSFNFTAIAEGTSRISVSIDECLDENMNSLGGGSGAASVTVGGQSAPQATQKPDGGNRTPGPTPRPTPTPVPVDQAEIESAYGDGKVYVWHKIPDKAEIPDGFEKAELTFKGETVQVLSRDDQAIVLAYFTDAKGENGSFALLRGETLLPFRTIEKQVSGLILLPLPEEKDWPEGFVQTEISLEDEKTAALKAENDPASVLLYAWSDEGTADWYLADVKLESISRFRQVTVEKEVTVYVTPKPVVTPKPTPVPTPVPTQEPEAETPEPVPSAALPWTLFGLTAAALAGSWIYVKRDALFRLIMKAKDRMLAAVPKRAESEPDQTEAPATKDTEAGEQKAGTDDPDGK